MQNRGAYSNNERARSLLGRRIVERERTAGDTFRAKCLGNGAAGTKAKPRRVVSTSLTSSNHAGIKLVPNRGRRTGPVRFSMAES